LIGTRRKRGEKMLSDTLVEGLSHYGIGEKLRSLRLKKKIGLVELGEHSGLSPALISKIERGKLFPTLPTLLRLALVFSVGLEYFFSETKDRPVPALVRKSERKLFPEKPNSVDVAYHFESLDFPATERRMSSYLAHFEPPSDGASAPGKHSHAGAEFIYMITGRLRLHFDGDEYDLDAGDSIYFDASVPHGYERLGSKQATGVVVSVP
jgi:transcriptional regulator with XRE-family HTH domain